MRNKKAILVAGFMYSIMLSGLQAQSVVDIDGNSYKTVTIGNQVWMTENLKTTKYNNGESIPLVTGTLWGGLTTPAFCWYDHDSATYRNTYGALYNWHAVNTNRLCPEGWHVPTDEDWKSLSIFLGGSINAGGKLKETGTKFWIGINTGATNETGFTALPGGYRYGKGKFGSIGYFGYWWSASEAHSPYAGCFYLGNESNSLLSHLNYRRNGYSVRCLKN